MVLTSLALAVSACLLLWSQRSLVALRAVARDALARGVTLAESGAIAHSGAIEPSRAIEPSAHVAELNELTIDLRGSLATPVFVAQRSARAALATGTLVALIQVARNLSAPEISVTAPLLSFAGGVIAMLACTMIGRAAEAEARGLRQHWNSLIRRSGRDVAIQAPRRSEAVDHVQGP
jgi:hypothetical protein